MDGVTYSFGIILDEIKLSTGEKEDICNLLSGLNTGFMFSSGKYEQLKIIFIKLIQLFKEKSTSRKGPLVAGFANKFGCRAVVMVGGFVTALMYILTVFSPKVWIMLITYGVIGGKLY